MTGLDKAARLEQKRKDERAKIEKPAPLNPPFPYAILPFVLPDR